jgi:hypothetical protein
MILSLSIHHGFSQGLQSGGILIIESLGSYLFARAFIRDEASFYNFTKFCIFIVFILSLVTVPESLFGKNIIRPHVGHIDPRFGFDRAFGPFDHPILYGCFCASLLALSWFYKVRNRLLRTSWVVIATFVSVSSGALAAAMVQFILIIWDKITVGMRSRWRFFSFLLTIGYVIIDLLSNRTPIKVFLSYLTFSPTTAYNRLIIWEWGTKENVAKHPWFGIGFEVWTRPSWMHSTSMDNFWLVNMVRYGLPSFIFLSLAVLFLLFAIGKNSIKNTTEIDMRTGFIFSLIGLIIAGCTVHFWNSNYVWFFFLLGSGACLAQSPANKNNG